MRFAATLAAAAALCAMASPALAAGKRDARAKLAVLDLTGQSVSKELAASATAVLASELGKLEIFRVISREDIKSMLSLEKAREQLGCEADQQCLAEIGGALGVEYMVAGSIAKLGDSFVLSLTLHDARKAQVENRITETIAGGDAALVAALSRSARQLVSPVMRSREGFLLLSVAESGALVKIDGSTRGTTPLQGKLTVSWGPHLLEIEKTGFVTHSEDISVQAHQAVSKTVQLVPSSDFIDAYSSSARKMRLGAYLASGAALAGLGSALVFNALSSSTESDFAAKRTAYEQGSSDPKLLSDMQTLHDRGNTQVAVARIALGVGAAAALAATYFWIAGDDPHRYDAFREAEHDKPAVSIGAAPAARGAALSVGGSF